MSSKQTGKESDVAAAVESLRKAMIAGDRTLLDKLTVAELSYGHASSRMETKAEFIDALVSGRATGKSGHTAIELTNQAITVLGNTAIVRHDLAGTRRDGAGVMKLRILQIWMEQPDRQWKLIARQAVTL
jgi:ketosteroid isomerase-like protein